MQPPAPAPTVLVLDGEQRAGLAATRSLGRAGCRVHVASHAPHAIGGGSRFATAEHHVPDPMGDAATYCAAVAALVQKTSATVVLPVTEASSLALLEHRTLLPQVIVPTSDLEHFHRACDKEAVLALAGSIGIDVPAQFSVSGEPGSADHVPLESFPLVVKPSRSVVADGEGRRKVGVRYASNPEELRQVLADLGPETGPHLLQARIEGPGVGVFLLRWRGETLATFAHRRIREKPPSGGVSVVCESVEPPTELIARSEKLLAELDWSGVAMVEYKRDVRTGRAYLMEVNPRLWGSLQLAIDAGVDFPWLLVQAAIGRPAAPVRQWKVGIRSRWWWGDIDHLIARLRRSKSALNLPPDAPSTFATALKVLVPWRPGQQNDVFRLSDPRPAIRESIGWVKELLGK